MNNFSALLAMNCCNKMQHCEETGYYNSDYKFRVKVPSSILASIQIAFTLVATLIRGYKRKGKKDTKEDKKGSSQLESWTQCEKESDSRILYHKKRNWNLIITVETYNTIWKMA